MDEKILVECWSYFYILIVFIIQCEWDKVSECKVYYKNSNKWKIY